MFCITCRCALCRIDLNKLCSRCLLFDSRVNEFPKAVIVMHVFIIGLISVAASCTRRQALHIDSVMSQGSVVLVVLLFPFPPTLSKMVASSPVLTFELCRPVLCWCLTGF